MKIEVGKQYIDARGELNYILYEDESDRYIDNKNFIYSENGRLFVEYRDKHDLICEVVPSIYEEYILKSISKKEFIKEHIKYWSNNENK